MLKRIHAYDIDGTLVDSSHRYAALPNGNVDLEHWLDNHYRIFNDRLLPLADQYKRDLSDSETYTVICTLRPPHALDLMFIREILGMPDSLIMNVSNETENLGNFKRRAFSRLFNLKQFAALPRFFWEDSRQYVESCRDLFTRVFHVESDQEFTA